MDTPTKFEVYGQEMIEKLVKKCGNSGRIYLPPDWIDMKFIPFCLGARI